MIRLALHSMLLKQGIIITHATQLFFFSYLRLRLITVFYTDLKFGSMNMMRCFQSAVFIIILVKQTLNI